jgi:hypothetical protein
MPPTSQPPLALSLPTCLALQRATLSQLPLSSVEVLAWLLGGKWWIGSADVSDDDSFISIPSSLMYIGMHKEQQNRHTQQALEFSSPWGRRRQLCMCILCTSIHT